MKIFCRNLILTALIILLGTTAACGAPPSPLAMPASSTANSDRLLKPDNSIGNMVVTTGSREAPHILESLALVLLGLLFGYVSGENPGPPPENALCFLMSVFPLVFTCIAWLIASSLSFENE